MNPLLIGLLYLLAIAALHVIAVFALIAWMARGESDVNGDPERDAGFTDEEIARHTSAPTTDLESARRQNREAMAETVGIRI